MGGTFVVQYGSKLGQVWGSAYHSMWPIDWQDVPFTPEDQQHRMEGIPRSYL